MSNESVASICELLLDQASETILITDDDGCFTFVCSNVQRIFGYSVEEVRGMGRIDQLLGGPLVDPVQLAGVHVVHDLPCTFVHKDGKTHHLLASVKAIDNEVGSLLYTFRDMAQRRAKGASLLSVKDSGGDVALQQENEERTRRHLNEITLLNKVMSLTALAQDLPSALQQACATLARFFEASQGSVAVFDDDQTILDFIADYKEDDRLPSVLGTRISSVGIPIIDYILIDKAPLAINDAQTDPQVQPLVGFMLQPDTQSMLLVPILLGDKVRGLLGLEFYVPRRFDAEELALAQNVANQLGQVFQRLTLYTQGLEHARLATRLSELGERLNRSFTLDEVMQVIGEGATELSGADRCAVFTRNTRGETVCPWSSGLSQKTINAMLNGVMREPWSPLLEMKEPVLLRNVAHMSGDATLRRLGVLEGYSATAMWPLIYEGRTLAVVACYYDCTHSWSSIEREVMGSFARQATSTIENARLFGEAQRRASELERLSLISSSLRSAMDRSSIQSVILTELLNMLSADSSALALFDTETLDLILVDSHGMNDALSGMKRVYTKISRDVLQNDQPYISADLRSHPLVDLPDLPDGPLAAVCTPLIVNKLRVGALWIVRARPFNDAEVSLILAVADMGASAIHRAQVVETLEQRVDERTQALAEANAGLMELDLLKSKFVSDVSHELRTPIQNLKMYLNLLEHGRPEKHSIYLHTLQEQVDLLQRLTEDILDLSRLELAPGVQAFQQVDLNKLVEQVYGVLLPSAEAVGLGLSIELDSDLPMLWADSNQLVQVITNLVANAINYTSAGTIKVSTGYTRDQIWLEVEDTGMGISSRDMPHLFDRFYRSNRVSQSNIRGTGLGLAIVSEIVNKHRGSIEVESQVDLGSTFRVRLPTDARG